MPKWAGLFSLLIAFFEPCGLFGADAPPTPAIRVALVGDSTVCDYPPESLARGWGEYLAKNLGPAAVVANFAATGASTRSFLASARWQNALASHPQYVLIQFGHNDALPGVPEVSTDPVLEYPANLRRFIAEVRAVGAKPILVTPMEIRSFDEAGALRGKLTDYADAMKKVAKKEGVPVIDLHTASCRLYQRLGVEGSAQLGPAPTDRIHFNEKGAQALAQLVAAQLVLQVPGLNRPRSPATKRKRS